MWPRTQPRQHQKRGWPRPSRMRQMRNDLLSGEHEEGWQQPPLWGQWCVCPMAKSWAAWRLWQQSSRRTVVRAGYWNLRGGWVRVARLGQRQLDLPWWQLAWRAHWLEKSQKTPRGRTWCGQWAPELPAGTGSERGPAGHCRLLGKTPPAPLIGER